MLIAIEFGQMKTGPKSTDQKMTVWGEWGF